MDIADFKIILPELLLLILAISNLMIGIFSRSSKHLINFVITGSLLLIPLIYHYANYYMEGFNASFVIDSQISTIKSIIMVATAITLIIYKDACNIAAQDLKPEFVSLMLLSVLGLFIAISARNFLLLFCALELSALTSYALAAFNPRSVKCSEGALKYFIQGSLISAVSAFGISFIYGFSGGNLSFANVGNLLINSPNIGIVVGLALFLTSVLFKLAASPLHFWAPDVYEGSPIASVIYFATGSKLAALLVLINIMTFVAYDYHDISVCFIKILAIFSMIIGALGAIGQTSLKRLTAYSAILNLGYSLIAVALNNETGYEIALLSMTIYVISAAGLFIFLIALLGPLAIDDATFETIYNAASGRKAIAAGITVIMFSMIGIPPLAGFFGKYYIFYYALKSGEITLVIIGVLTTIISAYYYLKVVKALYFMDGNFLITPINTRVGLLISSILIVALIILFSFYFNGFGII